MNGCLLLLACPGTTIENIHLYSLILKGGLYEKQESKNKYSDI